VATFVPAAELGPDDERDPAFTALLRETRERALELAKRAGLPEELAHQVLMVVDDPGRFAHSADVGPHPGLTPRRYQSGEIDRSGRISKCGDAMVRSLLFEAAMALLHRVKAASGLKRWARALAKRGGGRKAATALARKLAVILHRLWVDGSTFDPHYRRAAV